MLYTYLTFSQLTQLVYVRMLLLLYKLPNLEKRRSLFSFIEGHNCSESTNLKRRWKRCRQCCQLKLVFQIPVHLKLSILYPILKKAKSLWEFQNFFTKPDLLSYGCRSVKGGLGLVLGQILVESILGQF